MEETKSQKELNQVMFRAEENSFLIDFLHKYEIKHSLFYKKMDMNASSFMYRISPRYPNSFTEKEKILIKETLVNLRTELSSVIEKL